MPSETLLPCPFCGSVRVECAGEDSPFWKLCRAHCNDCGATSGTYFNTRAEAIAAWNRRAAHQERDADARRLARRLADATPPWLSYPESYERLAKRFHAILTDAAMAADTQTEAPDAE